MMESKSLAAAAAVLMSATLVAVTIGPEWCVAYPESGSKDVNRALRIAAEEVRDDINEAMGFKLKAVPASQAKAPAIWIGAEFAKKAGFDLSGFGWYDNAIAEKGGSVYLFGNDRPGRDATKFGHIGWFRCVLPSVKAATRFLETAAGVRFLMPGEVGKEVPKRQEIALADGSFSKEHPMLIFANGRSNNDRSLIYKIANGIWGMGPFHTYGGHTYPSACPGEKYFKDHPEYFGLIGGKRKLGPTPGQTPLCISNPEVEELIADELKRQFDMGADVCQLGQQDGLKVCGCEKCREMYGTGDDWGEKFWRFHRHIAERMLKERPGKIVHIMSYALTAKPPKTFKEFPPNVMIEMCKYGEDSFGAWKGYTVPRGFTVYTYLCGNYVQPGFVARHSFAYLAVLAKRFRENNVCGVYRCGTDVGDLFGTEGPGYYVFDKLLLDGSLSVNALVADYCAAAFGPAAEQMRRFYDVQDSRLRMCDRTVFDAFSDAGTGLDGYVVSARPKNPLDLHGWMFSPDTTAQMEEALSLAENTEGLSAKQRKRLELVRLEFDYAKNMGAISTLYSAYRLRPTKESIVPLLEEVSKRHAYIERLFAGKRLPKRLDGWPELQPFGSGCEREFMEVNGRLSAPIRVPLIWDADRMLKYRIVPNERMTPEERLAELKQAGIKPLTGFAVNRADAKKPGVMFEPYPDGTGFRFGQGSNRQVRVTARIGERQGLMPGRTYRISWLTRWENVNSTCSWNGYYFSAEYDVWNQKTRPLVQMPNRPLHSGSSKGWFRESVVMKACDKPGFVGECTFRFWGCTDGVAEVRDVALEEVDDLGDCDQKSIFRGL